MTKLSSTQIYALARGAGLSEPRAVIATAIALAESGGETTATGKVGEKGLWQIYPKAHPDWDKGGNLYDPFYNAKAMAAISNGGTNWTPWTTFKNKSYLNHLTDAEAATALGGNWQDVLKNLGKGLPPPKFGSIVPGSPLDRLSAVADFISAAWDFIKFLSNRDNWVRRVLPAVVGGILILIALNQIMDMTALGQATKAAGKTAVKAGASAATGGAAAAL